MSVQPDIESLLEQMATDLRRLLTIDGQTAMVGIHTGGVWVAERLHRKLELDVPLGTLDISFYRDDFTRIGMNPQVRPSELPFALDERDIILVDDVLHTGRTIRAAMNELFDYGRPASIVLAVLVERSGRELPIEASVVGHHMDLGPGEHVKLSGPDPLKLEVKTIS
ncbi:MAG TPA: bifunctional pyr operon transcriptional regulator/uracil phosphoribosyltransferase PyrR [Gammaproteobacteria bacterium]|nr:bifunctional pyr operon transcriptional regulator/uracil phosphoribosyltransferase PyrR [Gammaproteobacteria bacterium]